MDKNLLKLLQDFKEQMELLQGQISFSAQEKTVEEFDKELNLLRDLLEATDNLKNLKDLEIKIQIIKGDEI